MSLANMPVQGPFRSKHGLFLGVIRGLAEHYHWSPFTLRIIVIAAAIFLALWPVLLLYFAAAFIMPTEPIARPVTERDRQRAILGNADPTTMVDGLMTRSDILESKIRRLEDYVTSKTFRVS
ncbi:MAG: PspC domain-containing protein [Deltaproteobacteria bacterium]|nr:PspC domain-containing protein [Deltaproteobacteria bacterium]